MVRLEKELVEEVPKESAGGKSESMLKVRDENDILSFLGIRCDLGTGWPTFDSGRDPPRPDQPVNLGAGDIGAFPGGPGGTLHHSLLNHVDHVESVIVRHLGGKAGKSYKINHRR